MLVRFHQHRLQLLQGDVTRQTVDAIVNAANSRLLAGGGVDDAIHRAAGPGLQAELDRRYPQGCPTGEVVVTSAGGLPAKYVLHAVGPVWQGGLRGERDQLAAVYRRSLELAWEHGCRSLACPAISTGAYAYPIDLAAEQTLRTIQQELSSRPSAPPLEVRLVLFDAGSYAAFARVLEMLLA
jgi:O-acetyl-ADP-ribose deacetylase (regulator of RNase III)